MEQGLYQLIDSGQLGEILSTFNVCMQLPVQLIDSDGKVLQAYGETTSYCRLLKRHVLSPEACQKEHLDAGRYAQALGETYIFSCHANLSHIAFPLTHQRALLGAILVGPFLMDTPDSTLVSGLAERYDLSSSLLLDLYDELSNIRVISPPQVKQISKLLYYLLSPIIPAERQALLQNREKLYQQARIGETIQMYKTQGLLERDQYPYEKEKALLTKVRTGDVQSAKGVLNDLLGYVFFCEGGDMRTMKNRALELCTLLSRVAIEGGAVTDSVFRLNNQFLSALQEIDSLEPLCYELQEVVESFMDAMFSPGDAPGHEAVRKAVTYIAQHYASPLTLEQVAQHVALSPAYFSSLFKQNTGATFREYLNQIRVEESKRLLTMTTYSLVDIAMAMGFSDQSYYSKVFKRYTGLTPKQYR